MSDRLYKIDDSDEIVETNVPKSAERRRTYPKDDDPIKAPAQPTKRCVRCDCHLRENRTAPPLFIKEWHRHTSREKGYGQTIWEDHCTTCAHVLYLEDLGSPQ